ncbi:MAG: exodeoxyribonuclease VII large subunit [Thermodesulfovibrionales bacterium]|jgi:exodeoxyribonuclease VII large subunit
MGDLSINKKPYSLYELNSIIRSAISYAIPDACWVTAEIAELKCNQKGHCFLELVEKDDDRTIAQIRATLWASEYKKIGLKFTKATGESLKPGMKILLFASVTFHEVYGLSLVIRDIDPSYTIGDMARKKKEVIERLIREGVSELNRRLTLPLVPQRIAVISSPTAAGYGDFFNQLDKNLYGYSFFHVLFPAIMQGQDAEKSIISALSEIGGKKHRFDVVVIIRGGGSPIDLNCFDSYTLASQTARCPLPVITGIGHEKDDTVVDIVAHAKMKTPTAVAEFLIACLRSFEETIVDLQNRIAGYAERFMKDERYRLHAITQKLVFIPLRTVTAHQNRIAMLNRDLRSHIRQFIRNEEHRFNVMEQAVKHLDPANVLRRGYSITRYKGRILKDASLLKKWAVIETTLRKGMVTSIVQEKKEAEKREQKQADILLPGFD